MGRLMISPRMMVLPAPVGATTMMRLVPAAILASMSSTVCLSIGSELHGRGRDRGDCKPGATAAFDVAMTLGILVGDQAVDRRGFDQALFDFAGIELTAGDQLMETETRPIERMISRPWHGIGERCDLSIERGLAVGVDPLEMAPGRSRAMIAATARSDIVGDQGFSRVNR